MRRPVTAVLIKISFNECDSSTRPTGLLEACRKRSTLQDCPVKWALGHHAALWLPKPTQPNVTCLSYVPTAGPTISGY